jgi:drug/metabolite transporter (DMT)-like permease
MKIEINTRLAVAVLASGSIGWGLTWLPIKALSDSGLDGLHLVFIAFISGAILLLPGLYKQYPQWQQSLGLMLMIGITGGFANASFQTAIYHGDVIRVMILFYMLPVWSVIGGRLFLKEKMDSLRLLAVALSLSGAFVILDVWHTSWQGITWVDILAIGSGMGLAATNILFRFSQTIPLTSKIAFMFIGCTVLIGMTLLVFPTAAALPDFGVIACAIAYGALWLTLISFATLWAVTRMEAGRSAVIIVVELVVAVVSSALILGSGLAVFQMVGGLMVLVAALLEGFRSNGG